MIWHVCAKPSEPVAFGPKNDEGVIDERIRNFVKTYGAY